MRWILKPNPPESEIKQLADSLGVAPLVAQLLLQRGIDSFAAAKAFFRPQLEQLHDPFLMADMDVAVARIQQAISDNENILVYGDYDVDGTTAVALVSSYLLGYYPNVATYIPDRYGEGYGISYQGIDFAEDNGFTLIIALDCGIKAIDKVAYAHEKDIDFIICDHHRPGPELPPAVAVLDPKRDDCDYPYKELCGCGVGFKLIQALGMERGEGIDDLIPFLDLVATAIGADIVPITGENRILAFYGLEVINTAPRVGFKAIIDQLDKPQLTITDVVFIIAPRINAAGRMEHGLHAVNLLTQTNDKAAVAVAREIEQFNTDRRGLDQQITEEALELIKTAGEEDRFTTVVYQEHWHKGVIGIVASRLTETYYRPTLVFTKSGDFLAASARSVKGFDVYNALEACSEHIEQFGGHKYAAGLTLRPEKYAAFKNTFEEVVKNSIDPCLLVPELRVDAAIHLDEISPKLIRILKQFAPFGPGNNSPLFMSEHLYETGYAKGVGKDGAHLKLSLGALQGPKYPGIGFHLGNKVDAIKGATGLQAVYAIDENEWQGRKSIQLKVKDIR